MAAPTNASLIDQVDGNDRPIGLVPRGEVFDRKAGFRTVHVLATNREGQLLLQQVGAIGQKSPLRWGSSVAGYLHAGETYLEAAQRRSREEIGLESPLQELGQLKMLDHGATKFVHAYICEAGPVEILEPEHIEALRFWDTDDIDVALRVRPDEFTETFLAVYSLFRAAL